MTGIEFGDIKLVKIQRKYNEHYHKLLSRRQSKLSLSEIIKFKKLFRKILLTSRYFYYPMSVCH